MGRDRLSVFNFLCLCQISMKLGEPVPKSYGPLVICHPVSLSSLEKVIVRVEKTYVMENDETSMSPELI